MTYSERAITPVKNADVPVARLRPARTVPKEQVELRERAEQAWRNYFFLQMHSAMPSAPDAFLAGYLAGRESRS